jgi:hypothetical protein
MPNPVHETSAVTAEWAWSAPEQPASDSAPRCYETQTELARANRGAIPEQLSASMPKSTSRSAPSS